MNLQYDGRSPEQWFSACDVPMDGLMVAMAVAGMLPVCSFLTWESRTRFDSRATILHSCGIQMND